MEPQNSNSSDGRLQRPADFTGSRLTTFAEVFSRHGLPGVILAMLLFLSLSNGAGLLEQVFHRPLHAPLNYGLAGVAMLVGLVVYSALRYELNSLQLSWVVYLGFLSLWEEWVFRVAAPVWLQELGLPVGAAILLSNVLFGAMHYFTLRWRWQWCGGAFLGGLGFSMNFQNQGDLLLIAAIHWAATFFNTPRPPVGGAR